MSFSSVVMLSVVLVFWPPHSCDCDDLAIEICPCVGYVLVLQNVLFFGVLYLPRMLVWLLPIGVAEAGVDHT